MDVKIEFISLGVASLGWFCTILTRFLPMWTVTGTVENTTATLPLYWDGVWLNWQYHITGLHCTFFQSLLFLTEHFTTWKFLLISALGLGFMGVIVYPIGWIRYPKYVRVKAFSGPLFLLSGFPLLIVVSWTTHLADWKADVSLRRELATAIFTGWIGLVLLIVGGGMLSFICWKELRKRTLNAPQSLEPGVQYPLQGTLSTSFVQSHATGGL